MSEQPLKRGAFVTDQRAWPSPRLPVVPLGFSLGLFLVITYALCVVFDLLFPEQAMAQVWAPLLPGFTWLTWKGFLIGLVESFAYGWYVALVFAPLFNFFVHRGDAGSHHARRGRTAARPF